MRKRDSVLVLLLLLVLGCAVGARAQVSNTVSPYSRYGLGLWESRSLPQMDGFGGLTQGFRDRLVVNPYNPATFPLVDSLTLLFSMSVKAGVQTLSDPATNRSKVVGDAAFGHIAAQFPVSTWGGMALGFMPLTRMGYDVTRYETDPKILSSIGRTRYKHTGDGGLSEAFLGFGGAPCKYFSLGVNAHFLFGSINHSQDFSVPNNSTYAVFTNQSRYVMRGLRLSFGAQGVIPLDSAMVRSLILGVTVDYTPLLWTTNRMEVTSGYMGTVTQWYDNALRASGNVRLPLRYSAGVMYRSPRLRFGLDGGYEPWGTFELLNRTEQLGVAYEVRAGASYTPEPTNLRYYGLRMSYQLGATFEQLPARVEGKPVSNYTLSAGVEFPFSYNRSRVHLSFVYGARGVFGTPLVKERYYSLRLGVSFSGTWFFKRRYE